MDTLADLSTIKRRDLRNEPLRDLRSLWMTLTGASAWR